MQLTVKRLSSLDKVFLQKEPVETCSLIDAIFLNEAFSYQIAYYGERHISSTIKLFVENDYSGSVKLRTVGNVPSELPAYPGNRIIATQLYKYDIAGFLHWGYNFWYSQYSIKPINPFAVTDAGCAFPSGDPFIVYPGEDGRPVESIRLKVFREALYDLRAMKLLESLTSKIFVVGLIEENAGMPITFAEYPRNEQYLVNIRNRINAEIASRLR